jgi:RNA polymerase sigma factor (sigma-70 family)
MSEAQLVEPTAADDLALVERANTGDMEAIGALYEQYNAFVYRRARRLGAGVDDAHDVTQELFARLIEGRGWNVGYTNDGTLYKFLAVVVKRLVHDRAWRDKYWGALPEFEGDLVPLWTPQDESPEARVLRLERVTRLRAAFACLPQRMRQVAHLRYLECLSGPAIAARLGLSPKSLPSYLSWIRARVRPALAVVYTLPPAGRGGHLRFDTRTPACTTRQINQNAKRRRARAKHRASREVA